MRSTGNDIVSLAEIDVPRTRTKQFYSKILSATEVGTYHRSISPEIAFEHYVWLLWAMKEAAYKFLKRIEPDIKFIPVKFEVKELHASGSDNGANINIGHANDAELKNKANFRATVETRGYKVYAAAIILEGVISSVISSDPDFDDTFWGLQAITSSTHSAQSASARELLFGAVNKATGLNSLTLVKDSCDVPFLYQEDKEVQIPISLSHHGQFIGYSFLLVNTERCAANL